MPNALLTSRAIIGSIYNRLNAPAGSFVNRYAMRISSNQETENYAWLGQVPNMREWIGGRQPKGLRENTFAITNKDYEATLEILTKDLRRDNSGQIRVRISELSRRVLSFPAKLVTTLMINGESTVCYDGQYFFDTDHAEGDSGSQSNDLSVDISTLPVGNNSSPSAPTRPSPEEFAASALLGIEAILGFKDDQGEPMNEGAATFEVMVPTSLWSIAASGLSLPVLANGKVNIMTNLPDGLTVTPVVNPRLTWTDRFAVYRTDGDTKPFILQEEVPVSVDAVAEGSQLEFTDRKHWYGVQWAGNVGYGFWQHACLVTMT